MIILVVVFFILLLISATGIIFSEDILSIIPDQETSISRYKELLDNFDPLNRMYVTFEFTENFNEQELIKAADAFYNKMSESGFFTNIMYKWNYEDLLISIEKIRENKSALFNKSDLAIITEKLEYNNLLAHFTEWKKALTESMDPFLSRQFISDPVGLNEILLNKVISINSMQNAITIHNGRFFTNNLQKIIIIAEPVWSSTDSGNSLTLINFIENTIKTITADFPVLKVAYLSGHRFSLENAKRMKGDIQLTLTISILAILLLSFFIYKRPLLILLTLVPAIFGSVFSLGILKWIVPDISAIIIGCGAMFIGISVDYSIHILFHVDRISEKQSFIEKLKSILNKVTCPLLLSGGTTVAAFTALTFSVLPGYQQLGLFVLFGIIGALLFVLLILPLIIPRPKMKSQKRKTIQIGLIFKTLFNFIYKFKILIIILIIIISLAMIPGFLNVEFEGDISKLNVTTEEISSDMENVLTSLGNSADYILIAVKSPNLETALQQSEELNTHLDSLMEMSIVDSYNSIVSILPSIKQQLINLDNWNNFINSGILYKLGLDLKIISEGLNINFNFFENLIDSFKQQPDYITRNSYSNTILSNIISNQISVSGDSAMILTPVSLVKNEYFNQLKEKLDNLGLDIIVYSGKSFASEILNLIFSEMQRIILIAAIFVIALLFIINKNILIVIKMLAPLLLSLFWTFSIMGWFGIKINIVNCLVAVFIFGLVIDYCIFLVFAGKGSYNTEHVLDTSSAVFVSAITTILGLGALVFARHPALHSIGFTALIAISSGLLAVLILIPIFFHKKVK